MRHPLSRLRIKPIGSAPAPTPDPTTTVEHNPNYVLLMASSVVASSTQRTIVKDDIIALHTSTAGAVRPDIAGNLSWDNCETSFGVYDFSVIDNMVTMCEQINFGIGLAADAANGAKCYPKIFIRNYSSNGDGSSQPSVPAYMQSSAGSTYNGATYPGAGVNSNGEYQGFLQQGVGTGNLTRQAKIWVPSVAARFTAWMVALGEYGNDKPQVGGLIINETSVLNAANQAASGGNPAVFYGTTLTNPGSPTADPAIMAQYFQNYWQAVIDARSSWSKKAFFVSAGHPVTTLYTDQPLNPGVLLTNYAVGEYVQDGYAMGTYTPKYAVQQIAKKMQPYATTVAPFMHFISGDVRRHKGVDSTQTGASTSTHSATTGNKTFTITSPGGKTFVRNRVINLLANRNEANQVHLSGIVSDVADCWNSTTGALKVTINSVAGSGSRSSWEVAEGANYLPPSTLDEMVTEAVTARGSYSWSAHAFAGATHVAFQVNTTVKTGANENSRNYIEYLAYLGSTANRVKTARPPNLDTWHP